MNIKIFSVVAASFVAIVALLVWHRDHRSPKVRSAVNTICDFLDEPVLNPESSFDTSGMQMSTAERRAAVRLVSSICAGNLPQSERIVRSFKDSPQSRTRIGAHVCKAFFLAGTDHTVLWSERAIDLNLLPENSDPRAISIRADGKSMVFDLTNGSTVTGVNGKPFEAQLCLQIIGLEIVKNANSGGLTTTTLGD